MTLRRATLILLVPAALLGWAAIAAFAWSAWTYPVPVALCFLVLASLSRRRRRQPERPADRPAERQPHPTTAPYTERDDSGTVLRRGTTG